MSQPYNPYKTQSQPTAAPQTAVAMAPASQLNPGKLGLWGRLAVRKAQERATRELLEDAIRQEVATAKEVMNYAIKANGDLQKAHHSHVYGEQFVAVIDAVQKSHTAAALVQATEFTLASASNLLERNRLYSVSEQLVADQRISPHDAELLNARVTDNHIRTEDRIARMHSQLANATDELFMGCMNTRPPRA